MGIVSVSEAMDAAYEQGLDLVEVASSANPPVCKIMDFGKFKYEREKKRREARKKQKTTQLKELKMSPNIEEHDVQVRVRQARKFLENEDKVKITIMFRGREIVHSDIGRELLHNIRRQLQDVSRVEKTPSMEGRNMIMVLAPNKED